MTPTGELFKTTALRLALCCGLFTLAHSAVPATSPESQYASQMQKIMEHMHAGMQGSPSSAVDRQFVTLMIPHHQAAIEMAELQLREGHDARLTRIAQEIIVEQQQEIVVMRSFLASAP